MLLPSECIENLKCSICNRLLSVFPIYINKNDQHSSICGRCKLPDSQNYLRCEIYENLAKTVRFPCINQEYGCMLNLLSTEVEEHEENCTHRVHFCAFAQQTNCEWKGSFNQLFEHYKDEHQEFWLKDNQFEFDVSENHDYTNILQHSREMFFFQRNFNKESKTLKCYIRRLHFVRTVVVYYGQIDLTTKDVTITKKFPLLDDYRDQPILSDINTENALNEQDIKVKGTVLIVDEEEKLDYNTKLNQKLLQKFGNSKENYRKSFEDLFELFYIKCPYGCNYIAQTSCLSSHNNYCLYAPVGCSFDPHCCNWKGIRMDIGNHLQNDHTDAKINLNQIVQMDISKIATTEHFIVFCPVYKLMVCRKVQTVSFRMKEIHHILALKHPSFRFEISIFDEDGIERIRIRPSPDSDTGFNYELNLSQIKDVMVKNTLTFRLSILK